MFTVSHHTLPLRRGGKEIKPGVNLRPNGTLETITEAVKEAKFRMAQPQRAIKSEVTIQRLEDGTTLRRWIYDDASGQWHESPMRQGGVAFEGGGTDEAVQGH